MSFFAIVGYIYAAVFIVFWLIIIPYYFAKKNEPICKNPYFM